MRKCCEKCLEYDVSCPIENSDCRHWIDYEDDSNCVLIAVDNNQSDPMTLREVSKRMGVSFVRIKQIQTAAVKKLITYKQKNRTFE
jgi:DNA-directed RNA polymerase sigma subunit (sigma70/sigma32)